VFIEVGPASIVVEGERGGKAFGFDKEEIAGRLSRILAEVGEFSPVLREKGYRIKKTSFMSPVARKMVEAVREIDRNRLTPMAAVAGAVADALKEWLREKDLEFISVNNGGDVSLFNRSGKTVKIAMGDIGTDEPTPYILVIKGMVDCGVATSGFGGRSFTLGLADMVTVIARTGAIADAAATLICNATNVETDQVERRRAGEIDPCSDIAEEWVTVQIGELDEHLIKQALANGLALSHALKGNDSILDAVIVLKGHMVTTLGGDENIYMEVDYGDQEDGHGGRGYICGR
jgi:uncharacterized protein